MSPNPNVLIFGPRADFEALMKLLDQEMFPYHPQGLAAARAYDVIRECLDAVEEEDATGEPV